MEFQLAARFLSTKFWGHGQPAHLCGDEPVAAGAIQGWRLQEAQHNGTPKLKDSGLCRAARPLARLHLTSMLTKGILRDDVALYAIL